MRVRERLLAERGAHGHWEGGLSSSALSTATAVLALALVDRAQHAALIRRGLDWLRVHANPDGGWGDTVLSKSNSSTTALVWAAFGVMNEPAAAAEAWLAEAIRDQSSEVRGQPESSEQRTANSEQPTSNTPPSSIHHPPSSISPPTLAAAIVARYGKDRTFSVPILTACALAGRVSWEQVLPLPFELAVLPHQLFRWLRLPVVSYALPALIAIGQVRHHHLSPRNPLTRAVRNGARAKSLRVLEQIQPANGGFLEAAPLTSFVVMALAGMGLGAHPVAAKGVQFLAASARADGSWPIDTNLATWLTTLAVNALGKDFEALTTEVAEVKRGYGGEDISGRGADLLRPAPATNATPLGRSKTAPLPGAIKDWLITQQYRVEHPFTHAAPGGWSWTDLPGGVPDADDTAGALLALKKLTTEAPGRGADLLRPASVESATHNGRSKTAPLPAAVNSGIQWLLDLQNSDGGIPTFCRGWGALPFDRSAPDLTAHALCAFAAWRDQLPPALQTRVDAATQRALRYLAKVQRAGGAWSPLWFGNQYAPGEENLTYGTAQVLRGLQALHDPLAAQLAASGAAWLLAAQKPDGSWAGGRNAEANPASPKGSAGASIEHRTANIQHRTEESESRVPGSASRVQGSGSIEETALAVSALAGVAGAESAVERGVDWLITVTEAGRVTPAAPIGLYFAKLWYFERLYPLVFLAGALERVAQFQAVDK